MHIKHCIKASLTHTNICTSTCDQPPRPPRRRGACCAREDKEADETPADAQHGLARCASSERSLRERHSLRSWRSLRERPSLHSDDKAHDEKLADPETRSISSSHHQIKPRRTNQPASKPAYLPAPARCHLGLNSARVITTASEPAPTRPAPLSRSRSRPRGDREDPAQQKQLRRQRRSGDHRHQRRDRLPEHIRRPNVSLSL